MSAQNTSTDTWIDDEDAWTDDEDGCRQILICLSSGLFSQPQTVNALLERQGEKNFVSVSLVRRLLGPLQSSIEIGSQKTLEWRLKTDMKHCVDPFVISQDAEFDVKLGAKACEIIDELEEEDLIYELLPTFVTVGKETEAELKAKEAEKKKRKEEEKKEDIRRLERKYGIQHMDPNQNPPTTGTA